MKILKILFLLTFCVNYLITYSQQVDNYNLIFSKKGQEASNLHITCQFDILVDSLSANTIELKFGGVGRELSVDNLVVKSDNIESYDFDFLNKKIIFILKKRCNTPIFMEYEYCNFASFFLYGDDGPEMWETSYNEFFYPLQFGVKSMFECHFDLPDCFFIVGGYPISSGKKGDDSVRYTYISEKPIPSHSVVFGLLPKDLYQIKCFISDNYDLQYYIMRDRIVPVARLQEVNMLTKNSIDFFSECYSCSYADTDNGLLDKPVYVLHNNGHSNRNNINFIIASQEKVSNKPHLFPLVHEIGHRWIGEWTLWMKDGKAAAYFIVESLNEYMTLLFVKRYYGNTYFEKLLHDEYMIPYDEIRDTERDASLFSMIWNNNNDVVYKKGPLVIHEIVKKMGDDEWIRFMRCFYLKYRYAPELSYDCFINLLKEENEVYANELDKLVRGEVALPSFK